MNPKLLILLLSIGAVHLAAPLYSATPDIIKIWNPNITKQEALDIIESSEAGCKNGRARKAYYGICAQEGGFKWIWNGAGCGYSGTTWATLINSAKKRGMRRPIQGWRIYFSTHRRKANYFGACAFADWWDARADKLEVIRIWHRSHYRDGKAEAEARRYCRKVLQIIGRMEVGQ